MDYILHILGFIEMILMLLVKVFTGVSLVLIAVFAIFMGYCYLHIFIVSLQDQLIFFLICGIKVSKKEPLADELTFYFISGILTILS